MSIISGNECAVNGWKTVASWTLRENRPAQSGVYSNTAGGTASKSGNRDCTGQIVFGDEVPAIYPGTTFTFTGFTGTGGGTWTGPAIVTQFAIAYDFASGSIVQCTADFGQYNGAISTATGTVADATEAALITATGSGLTFGGVTIAAVTTASLNLVFTPRTYVTAGTAGETFRTATGAQSATGSFSVLEGTPASVLRAGACNALTMLAVGAGLDPWTIEWARITDVEHGADNNGSSPVAATYSWEFTAVNDSGVRGQIIKPDGTTWWE